MALATFSFVTSSEKVASLNAVVEYVNKTLGTNISLVKDGSHNELVKTLNDLIIAINKGSNSSLDTFKFTPPNEFVSVLSVLVKEVNSIQVASVLELSNATDLLLLANGVDNLVLSGT